MIIKTRRNPHFLVIDAVLTASAWLTFIYLFSNGVVYLLSAPPSTEVAEPGGMALGPTATTLAACAAVCLFNASVVYLWACWKRAPGTSLPAHATVPELATETLAQHFSVSASQLGDIRDSRVTIVYHSPTGGIMHLETGDRHAETASAAIGGSRLRVA
ncbi:MAG TPA: poly-beta-1,6-N-acetyl-D-glucosamine biosynthesis protein PgaD [Burkholderiaceae bacterium]|nr:poly-beta-1,6-N-acetyl-D-glucosamine biosynthesis protein PgaD [Burkholderiaceae bacterium]